MAAAVMMHPHASSRAAHIIFSSTHVNSTAVQLLPLDCADLSILCARPDAARIVGSERRAMLHRPHTDKASQQVYKSSPKNI